MADPEVSGNNAEYQKLVRAMSEIQDAVEAYAAYKNVERQLADAKEMLKESEGGAFSRGGAPLSGGFVLPCSSPNMAMGCSARSVLLLLPMLCVRRSLASKAVHFLAAPLLLQATWRWLSWPGRR